MIRASFFSYECSVQVKHTWLDKQKVMLPTRHPDSCWHVQYRMWPTLKTCDPIYTLTVIMHLQNKKLTECDWWDCVSFRGICQGDSLVSGFIFITNYLRQDGFVFVLVCFLLLSNRIPMLQIDAESLQMKFGEKKAPISFWCWRKLTFLLITCEMSRVDTSCLP